MPNSLALQLHGLRQEMAVNTEDIVRSAEAVAASARYLREL